MLKAFSSILQSSLIEFAFEFKRYMCKLAQGVQNSYLNQALRHTKSYSKQVSIKLEACSKHTKCFTKGKALEAKRYKAFKQAYIPPTSRKWRVDSSKKIQEISSSFLPLLHCKKIQVNKVKSSQVLFVFFGYSQLIGL